MKTKMLGAALTLTLLAGCNNPATVGAGTTDREALTRAEAINSAKTMAKAKDYSVTVQTKPYGLFSKVMPAVTASLCLNDFIKEAQVTYEKSIYQFRLSDDLVLKADHELKSNRGFFKNDYGVGKETIEYSIQKYQEFKASGQEGIEFYARFLDGNIMNESLKAVDKCHFAALVKGGVSPEGGWPTVADNKEGRYRFMKLKLVQSYLASKHFFILAQAVESMQSPSYEDVLEIVFSYFNDTAVVDEALADAAFFAGYERVYTADLSGVEGVRFYTSDGYVYSTDKGSPSLSFMGGPWFNQDYVEGNAISYTTSVGSSVTMMKQTVSKSENLRGAINEVAAKVGI